MPAHSKIGETTVIMKKAFVIIYRPGPAWREGKPIQEQPIKAHFEYMHQLNQEGKIISGGPFADNTGGLLLLEADNTDEVITIMTKDPAVANKVFVGEVHQWNKVQWEYFEKIRAMLRD
jgi:uncharacterized protein